MSIEVVAQNVFFSYESGADFQLSDISFEISGGTFAAIIGPSGAGKSTIFDLILGVCEPSEGIMSLQGMEPASFIMSHPGKVAFVPQFPPIVSGSLLENVALGSPVDEVDSDRAFQCLQQVGLDFTGKSMTQPKGLSGGQLQRLGIARALYTQPKLLLLDEPTSALDADNENLVMSSLNLLRGSCTVVVIAHRLSTIKNADNVLVLEQGRITDSGSFAELQISSMLVARQTELLSFD